MFSDEVVDEAQALELVGLVEVVADFLLAALRAQEEVECAGLLAEFRGEQPAALE